MTDKDTPRGDQYFYVVDHPILKDAEVVRAEDYDRLKAELRQQLAELEQKRKEDIRKIEDMAARHYIPGHSVAGPQFSDVLAQGIRAAFPDVFKEKDNEC